ncbi:MAG: DEAD/DEAH box helicase [Roseburia sp.]|nr:DEAD/DEAH box helicase [Roseburia sp.]MCM1098448.1 DEAD/DEAH box helicase [Ruminococcus flavefaciens]
MVQKEKLSQFYFSQYKDCALKLKKKNNDGKKTYKERIDRLLAEMQRAKDGRVSQAHLEEYHRQIRNLAYFAFRENNQIAIMKIRDLMIDELVRLDITGLKQDEQELITAKFLDYLRTEQSFAICQRSLRSVLTRYINVELRNQIIGMVPTRPETEFPQALEMTRKFILHIGPTNCGKTYQALERLKQAENGVYLGPLRLLALEVYEKMKDAQIPCTMLTGEERIYEENSRIISSTVEMLDLDQKYDVAVIDEAQMIADPDRGHSWTRAILGVQADEIHVCLSASAEEVITHLISLCNDTFEIHRYERKTPLICEDKAFSFPDDVQEGDALIVFTKRMVLDIAGRLERNGHQVSVIYGSLPPEIRRRQIRIFAEGKTHIVVSTDAIGMGLNLPVRRIVFVQTSKFDGKHNRPLNTSEVRQIAGRAGRFGLYDTGYVNAVGEEGLAFIRERFGEDEPRVDHVSLGFPQVLLDMDDPLDAVITIWKSVEIEPPFEKISIEDILFLYEKAYRDRKEIDGFEDKHTLYRMLTCSIDTRNRDVVSLWLYYCKTYTADVSLHFPALIMCSDTGLMRYETFYKLLDLYYQFSVRLGKEVDSKRLEQERAKTEDTIMRYLSRDKKMYIRKCQCCGTPLDFESAFGVCDSCYAKQQQEKKAAFSARRASAKTADRKADRAPEKTKPRRRRRRSKPAAAAGTAL